VSYYSDVVIAIYGPEDDMLRLIAKDGLEQGILARSADAIERRRWYQGSGAKSRRCLLLVWRDQINRWGTDNPDTDAWEALMSGIESAGGPVEYEFVRVGEDMHDVERYSTDGEECMLSPRVVIDEDLPGEGVA